MIAMVIATQYQIVIGLEVHAQLSTDTKLFCSCSTTFAQAPNANTCPICMGYPGVLPVINAKAVEYALRAGLALDCKIDPQSKFDRKQYFYPDLPKGYQISQWDRPICEWGKLNFHYQDSQGQIQEHQVAIRRIHMEEDAGKLVHASETSDARLHGSDYSLLDLNRAGTPLIEIVSEPEIFCAEQAVAYVKELRKILMAIGVCDGNMQEGSLRCDVNISLHKTGQPFGTRAEIKNVNSFRSISRAIDYEYKRQSELLDAGKSIDQETRLFDEESGRTFTMRSKEDAHDYRYFPEPDLVPLNVPLADIEMLRQSLPELPQQKLQRYISEFSLNTEVASILLEEMEYALFFEETLREASPDRSESHLRLAARIANYLVGSVAAYLKQHKLSLAQSKLSPKSLADMVLAIESSQISDNIAKNEIIEDLLSRDISVSELITSKGLAQITDTGALRSLIEKLIAANPKQYSDYRAGNTKLKGFFVGQVMKETQGKASPQIINEILDTLA